MKPYRYSTSPGQLRQLKLCAHGRALKARGEIAEHVRGSHVPVKWSAHPRAFGGEPEWWSVARMHHALRELAVGNAVVLAPGVTFCRTFNS
jgi:hypothetical protein